jgi:actin-related protein
MQRKRQRFSVHFAETNKQNNMSQNNYEQHIEEAPEPRQLNARWIVIDAGKSQVRAGFSGEMAPRAVFPVVTARPRTEVRG